MNVQCAAGSRLQYVRREEQSVRSDHHGIRIGFSNPIHSVRLLERLRLEHVHSVLQGISLDGGRLGVEASSYGSIRLGQNQRYAMAGLVKRRKRDLREAGCSGED